MTYDTSAFKDKILKLWPTSVPPISSSNTRGDIRYADGTTWDPSYEEGYYFWNQVSWIPMFDVPLWDLHFFAPGTYTASEVLLALVMVRDVTIPANLSGSYGKCLTAPTSSASIDIQKNGSSFGTISISGSATTATFSTSATTFAAGDVLKIIAPSSADATLAGFFLGVKATR